MRMCCMSCTTFIRCLRLQRRARDTKFLTASRISDFFFLNGLFNFRIDDPPQKRRRKASSLALLWTTPLMCPLESIPSYPRHGIQCQLLCHSLQNLERALGLHSLFPVLLEHLTLGLRE